NADEQRRLIVVTSQAGIWPVAAIHTAFSKFCRQFQRTLSGVADGNCRPKALSITTGNQSALVSDPRSRRHFPSQGTVLRRPVIPVRHATPRHATPRAQVSTPRQRSNTVNPRTARRLLLLVIRARNEGGVDRHRHTPAVTPIARDYSHHAGLPINGLMLAIQNNFNHCSFTDSTKRNSRTTGRC